MKKVKVLKCLPEDLGNQFNDFKYPKWTGEPIEITCPDWKPDNKCGGGFHGITRYVNRYDITVHGPIFQVMEVDDSPENLITIWGEKVKFRTGKIIYQGEDGYRAMKMVFDSFSDSDILKRYGWLIKFIKDPSEELQIESVTRGSYSIKFIKNPCDKAVMLAIKGDPGLIKHIKSPSEEAQLAVVKYSPYYIRWIEKPSEKVQLEAVRQDHDAIRHIKNPTNSVQLEAVKNSWLCIKYIEDPSEKAQLVAVKSNKHAIHFIKNPTEAVKKDAGLLPQPN